jgi:hypothetical protein
MTIGEVISTILWERERGRERERERERVRKRGASGNLPRTAYEKKITE